MNELPPIEPTPPPVPQPLSLMDRLTGVFVSPGEVFDSLKTAPPAMINWLLPAIVWVLAGWVGAAIMFASPSLQYQLREAQEQAIRKQLEKANLPPDKVDEAVERSVGIATSVAKVAMLGGPLVLPFLSVFFWAFLLWLGGVIFGHRVGFMRSVEAVGLGNSIAVLDSLSRSLLAAGMGSIYMSASPVLFLHEFDPTSLLHNALGVLNVITLWVMVVRTIAFSRLSGLSLAKSGLWVFGFCGLFAAFALGAVLVGQMASKLGH